jgi:3-oxoacyl-[acyl-carrier protein] reductase
VTTGGRDRAELGGTALITGAGRGIGRATALRLARDGWTLALAAREDDEVAAVAEEVRALGRRAHAGAFDVADPSALGTFVDEATSTLGPIGAVVSNAGTILLPDDLERVDAERFDRTMAVNARAAYLLAGLTVPAMLRRGQGRFVAIASTAGLRGLPERLAYVASKHALVGVVRSLAAEVRRSAPGVTVNAVCPGAVRTRLTEGSRPDADRAGWLEPEDVAATVAWLLGPDGARTHGAILELDDRS